MFANCQWPGVNLGLPDTLIPMVPGPPIPGINISVNITGAPMVPNVLFMGGPAHTMLTKATPSLSIPVPPGTVGVLSGTAFGPTSWILGAFNVLILGQPATRWLVDPTLQNLFNCIGRTIVPSQFKVLVI